MGNIIKFLTLLPGEQRYQGLCLVFMLNHIHLIVESSDVSGFIRDFKKYTSKELKKNIIATEPGILKLFEENGTYQFWSNTNMPELIESERFYY